MRTPIPILVMLAYGCGGNPYGYAPEYAPLDDEEPYFEQGQAHSYEEVRRNPSAYSSQTIAWFGVVNDVQARGKGGEAQVSLTLHFHQQRHLCADQFDSSCRVTISQKKGGPFSAVLTLRPEDRAGRDRVYSGSLLKIYGNPTAEYDEEGGPILETAYYRHWPRGTYVTTGRAINMRR
ncbi:MAG: hypothetical protein OXT09_13235 [Myxococcales bacterium]|nr:hypothetical protein [Myxococcales bacterium]